MSALGAQIRNLRQHRGLTQADLASQTCTRQYVTRVEKGTATPSADILVAICAKLQCTVSTLAGYYEESQDQPRELAKLAVRMCQEGAVRQAYDLVRRRVWRRVRRQEFDYLSGQMLDEAGYPKAALSLYGRALPRLSGSKADCLFRIARCNRGLGRLTDALEMYIEALRLSSQSRSADLTLRAKILLNLANVEYALSAAGSAMNHYRDGLRLARETRDADLQIRCLVGVAVCQLDQEQYDEALGVLSQAETISHSVGRNSLLPVVHTNQAVAYRALGRLEDAVQLLQQSLSEKRAAGQIAETLYSLNELTEIFIESGDLVQARLHSQEALLLVDSLHDARELSSTFELASRLALCADDLEAAGNFVSRALANAEVLPGWRRGVLLCLSAEVCLRTNAAEAAIDGLHDVSIVLKAIGKEESRK